MRILLCGGSGTLGSALRQSLPAAGHSVVSLVRRPPVRTDEVRWQPENLTTGGDVASALAEMPGAVDGVVCLSSAGIADRRWTAARKSLLRESRLQPLAALGAVMAAMPNPPGVVVSASGVNCYGDGGEQELTEASPLGAGFLAELCREWESAAMQLAGPATRVTPLRFGAVLTPAGGMLKKLLPVFRMGLGGAIGNGRQYVSWISITDACRAVEFALTQAALAGPLNAVAPQPVRSVEFARALGRALHRPAVLPVPALALRLTFGEMADGMLLASTRALPMRLSAAGFHFVHPTLEAALNALLQE